jgi:hypothetical protein
LNNLSFFVLSVLDTNNLLIIDVGEVRSLVLEDLPPVGAGTVDLHVGSLSRAMDIEGLVVVSRSDSS